MLSEEEIGQISKHQVSHQINYCSCPCFDALMKVAKTVKLEDKIRKAVAKASPELLAALELGNEEDQDRALATIDLFEDEEIPGADEEEEVEVGGKG